MKFTTLYLCPAGTTHDERELDSDEAPLRGRHYWRGLHAGLRLKDREGDRLPDDAESMWSFEMGPDLFGLTVGCRFEGKGTAGLGVIGRGSDPLVSGCVLAGRDPGDDAAALRRLYSVLCRYGQQSGQEPSCHLNSVERRPAVVLVVWNMHCPGEPTQDTKICCRYMTHMAGAFLEALP